jgi:hypothetical protein
MSKDQGFICAKCGELSYFGWDRTCRKCSTEIERHNETLKVLSENHKNILKEKIIKDGGFFYEGKSYKVTPTI